MRLGGTPSRSGHEHGVSPDGIGWPALGCARDHESLQLTRAFHDVVRLRVTIALLKRWMGRDAFQPGKFERLTRDVRSDARRVCLGDGRVHRGAQLTVGFPRAVVTEQARHRDPAADVEETVVHVGYAQLRGRWP